MKSLNIIVLVVALFFGTPLFAAQYDHVIVFGDSLSDIGNNTWANHDLRHPDVKPGAPITNDVNGQRGPLWIQDLILRHCDERNVAKIRPERILTRFSAPQEKTRMVFFHPGVLPLLQGCVFQPQQPKSITRSLGVVHDGILSDYAWAGATSMNRFTNDAGVYLPACTASVEPCDPGVQIQIKNYIEQKNVDTRALYIIWIGGNDLFNNTAFLRDMILNPKNFKTDFDSLSWHPASNVVKAASMLVKAGVPSENIVIINLPDLTRAPLAQNVLVGHPVLERLARSTVLMFNKNLAEKIKLYNWWHGRHLRLLNIYPLLQQVFDEEGHDGFTNVTDPCVDNPKALAEGCPGYLFYNGKHPTTQAGRVIAGFVGGALSEATTSSLRGV